MCFHRAANIAWAASQSALVSSFSIDVERYLNLCVLVIRAYTVFEI